MALNLVSFGEVLFDVLPTGEHLGGAPLNLAVHARHLGAQSAIVTRLGRDDRGERAAATVRAHGVCGAAIQWDDALPTGTAVADMQPDGSAVFTISQPAAWDAIDGPQAVAALADFGPVDALCFGTLSLRGDSRRGLAALCDALRPRYRFLDINLRAPFYGEAVIRACCERANLLKINDIEAGLLGPMLYGRELAEAELAEALLRQYGFEAIIVTRGEKGCAGYAPGRALELPGIQVQVIDTVGSGDAFSAAFLTAYCQGADLEEALRAGNRRGAAVAAMAGALPPTA